LQFSKMGITMSLSEAMPFVGRQPKPRQLTKGNAPAVTGASYPNADVYGGGLSKDYSHILGYFIANPQP
jgi:hypothetical protein